MTSQLITEIFEVCIIPLLGVLVAYFVKYINAKSAELSDKVINETQQKYITLLSKTITECVIATNQTYVDSLKTQGKFDKDAQKIAFETTLNAVLNILSDEAKDCLNEVIGDLNTYIINQIEASVNTNKTQIA